MQDVAAAVHMALSQLYTNAIHDKRILQAMAAVPREAFLPPQLRGVAYVDESLEVGEGRHLMAPLTFARLLDLASITPECRVLAVGCLTGYPAAVIAQLAGHVTAIENDASMLIKAEEHLERLGIRNVTLRQVASLSDGLSATAPYNVIVIHGAIQLLPETLGAQLAVGGRLVAVRNVAAHPGFAGGLGKGLLVKKIDQRLQYREFFDASGIVLPGFERSAGFAF